MNINKRKGSAFEQAVADYLGVERRVQGGIHDRGDLAGVTLLGYPCVVECKATQSIDLATACNEAVVEARNAKAPFWVTIHKRRNHSVEQAYVTMPLEQFAWVLRRGAT